MAYQKGVHACLISCLCSLFGMPQEEGSRTTFDPSSAYCESRGSIVVD